MQKKENEVVFHASQAEELVRQRPEVDNRAENDCGRRGRAQVHPAYQYFPT